MRAAVLVTIVSCSAHEARPMLSLSAMRASRPTRLPRPSLVRMSIPARARGSRRAQLGTAPSRGNASQPRSRQPPAGSRRRRRSSRRASSGRRSSAPASTSSASTSSSPTRSGDAVLDLKQDDFEVREDKKPQKIDTFDVVKIDARHADRARRRRRAIRSDLRRRARSARSRTSGCSCSCSTTITCAAATTWRCASRSSTSSQNQLAPQDMVAIMYPLTPVTDLRFTRDRDALDQRRSSTSRGASSTTSRATSSRRTTPTTRRDGREDPQRRHDGRAKGAAVKLGGLREGRKSIIFVSEGFTGTLPPQLHDPVAALPGVGNPYARRPGRDAGDRATESSSSTRPT